MEHNKEGRYYCTKCDKSYSAKISLKYHMMSRHSDLAEIKCEKCDENFPDVKAYLSHKAIHRPTHFQQKHKCSKCDKILGSKYSLNQHKSEVHNLETKYDTLKVASFVYSHKCADCGESFKRKSDLDRHQKAVHMKVCFQCNICEKKFKYKTNLKRHEKTAH